MAHPLTQHPPNVLAFGAPASMSPLGFGFGQPHGAATQGASPYSPRPGFGFGSPLGAGTGTAGLATPLKRIPPRVSPAASPAPYSTKRSRRRSSSPSLSPSPTHGSPVVRKHDDDELRDRKVAVRKRLRKEQVAAEPVSEGPDVGLLLASFPASSHLPILLELLNENPHLAPRVLKSMPQPPLANCLETLERIVSKIGKAAGSWEPQEGYVAQRRWNRVEPLVSEFEKTAATYLKFFTQPTSATSSEPNTIYHLLHALTSHVLLLLSLVSSQANAQPPTAARPLLDLANLILTSWNQWISGLSEEVNTRGGMYPHPTVTSWADGLAGLTRAPAAAPTTAPIHSSWATPLAIPTQQVDNHLADGFRQAIQPIRERFANELGWLVRP